MRKSDWSSDVSAYDRSVSRISLWGESGGGIRKDIKMKGFIGDIENLTEENEDFRRVLYTGRNLQLVLMALKPGEEIGLETHADRDQFFPVEKGRGEVLLDGVCPAIKGDDGILVPAGAQHHIVTTGDKRLQHHPTLGR